MKKKPTTLKEWAARSAGRQSNTRRGGEFEQKIAAELGGAGYACDVVEISRQMIVRRGRSAWITKKADFWGCIDIIAAMPGAELLLIQATLDDSASMFKRKAAEIEKVFVTKTAGRRIIIVQPWAHDPDDVAAIGRGVRYCVHEMIAPGHWSRALLANVHENLRASGS